MDLIENESKTNINQEKPVSDIVVLNGETTDTNIELYSSGSHKDRDKAGTL